MEIFTDTGKTVLGQNSPKTNPPPVNAQKNKDVSNTADTSNDVVLISNKAKIAMENSGKNTTGPVSENNVTGSLIINNNRISYSLTQNNDLIVKIIDKNTDEVVKQIPPDEMIKIKEALLKALEQSAQNIDIEKGLEF